MVKVGHSSGVESRANPPAPPSFPALAQGGWMLVRGDLLPPSLGGEAELLHWKLGLSSRFLPLYLKGVGCSLCFAQLGSAPARAPLQDGLCGGMSPPSHPADLPGPG